MDDIDERTEAFGETMERMKALPPSTAEHCRRLAGVLNRSGWLGSLKCVGAKVDSLGHMVYLRIVDGCLGFEVPIPKCDLTAFCSTARSLLRHLCPAVWSEYERVLKDADG